MLYLFSAMTMAAAWTAKAALSMLGHICKNQGHLGPQQGSFWCGSTGSNALGNFSYILVSVTKVIKKPTIKSAYFSDS